MHNTINCHYLNGGFKNCISGASNKGVSYNQWQLRHDASFPFYFYNQLGNPLNQMSVGQIHCHLLHGNIEVCQWSKSFVSWGFDSYVVDALKLSWPLAGAYELLMEMVTLMMVILFSWLWGCLDVITAFSSTCLHDSEGFVLVWAVDCQLYWATSRAHPH